MTIRRSIFAHDDLAQIIDRWNSLPWATPSCTFLQGELYNPETHDLVPKESFKKQQLKFKEQKLQELKERRKNDNMLYDEQEKELKLEIDTLRQKINAP
jgi:hypothetical protein